VTLNAPPYCRTLTCVMAYWYLAVSKPVSSINRVTPVLPAQSQPSHVITSSCTTAGDRPHRCCHLANNIGSRRIVTSQWTGTCPQIAPFLGSGPHLIHGSLCPPESIPQKYLDLFSRFSTAYGCDEQTHTHTHRQTHRQTHRPRNVGNSRPHLCTPCVRCDLIMENNGLK